ncbi:MAG: hypothetical protein EA382_17660 [Spirochaetaceae bacterium]|nr:MAG: hypothetical protein EA382_17660 [Spirochaetaceae bacterium]
MPAVIEGVSDTNTPYDTLFRAAFVDPQTARELTLFLLPEAHSRRLAGARVTVEPESLVDQQARTHRTDLLLQFDLDGSTATGNGGSTVYVYVLYEHKSYPHRWVTLQLLRYMTVIWQRLADERGEDRHALLPPILPVVLYHGKEKWDAPLQFAELIVEGADSRHVPHYRPIFLNLTKIPDDRITGSLRAMLGLLALKHARLDLEEPAAQMLTELLHLAHADPAARHLARVVEYIYVTVKSEDEVDALMAAASRLGYHEVEGDYMTFAQVMLEKGRNEGLEQGLEQGSLQRSREVLIRLVDRKFGLTDAERERIVACEDQSALDAALDEILDAGSKAQVLARL